MELETIDRIYRHSESGEFAVDLFPYKIQNRDLFYNRDHPKDVDPSSFEYTTYWEEHLKNYIEGRWIYDVDTWVYMPNKLDFYINYTLVVDEERTTIQPRLRDNEWIIAYYIMICDGFYGFEEDSKYTCHPYVKKMEDINNGVEGANKLNSYEKGKLDTLHGLKDTHNNFKKYIDPWTYLTEVYLITDKRDKPLGAVLYDRNRCTNGVILGARGTAKSFCVFMMDFLHEWLFSGVYRWEDRHLCNRDYLFAMGSGDSRQLQRSVGNIKRFYNKMPGSYKHAKRYGAAYKMHTGNWESGSTVHHQVTREGGTREIVGSTCQMMVITPQNTKIGAGDRFRRIYVEEVGFVPYIKEVHRANKDSLRVGGSKIGSAVYLGTGGNGDDVKEVKDMFENPYTYEIASMRNYFNRTSPTARCGLFLPAIYKKEELKDKQGNTIIMEALQDIVDDRTLLKGTMDSVSFQKEVAWNPLYPKEMLNVSATSLYPIIEMADVRQELVESKFLITNAQVGKFVYNKNRESGVEFKPDLTGKHAPILEWGNEKDLQSTLGAWILYEDVIYPTPANLYYVVYDPVAVSGTGTSLNSALIYKRANVGYDDSMSDNIVGEWVGRTDVITDAYQEVIKVAKYFNAQIFCETNVNYFVEYCRENKYMPFLFPEPIKTLQLMHKGKYKRSRWKKGVRMNKILNDKAFIKSSDWLRQEVDKDEVTGAIKYKFEDIRSLRLLSELVNYDHSNKTEFDHVSSLFLLMILKTELDRNPLDIKESDEDSLGDRYDRILENRKLREMRKRATRSPSILMQTV